MNTCCQKVRDAQEANIEALEVEHAALVADGNEYHAAIVRGELVAARSLARLVHRHGEV